MSNVYEVTTTQRIAIEAESKEQVINALNLIVIDAIGCDTAIHQVKSSEVDKVSSITEFTPQDTAIALVKRSVYCFSLAKRLVEDETEFSKILTKVLEESEYGEA